MSGRLPWTKLQDFYLRLGFLKILVASLSWERRSATIDAIIRRLEHPLFDAIGARTQFRAVAETLLEATDKKSSSSRSPESVEVVEALVSDPSLPSALYAITRKTAYKVVDWGRDIAFLARANQISERALLLQSLLPRDESQRFLAGDPTAWNPFILALRERLFFLYHALEHDLVTVQLIEELAARPPDDVIETRLASQMTCGAIFKMLDASERLSDADSIREHRTALELVLTMADEVGAPVPAHWARHASHARSLREMKVALRKPGRGTPLRKTTKNADHQAIPRFEQLVDLGFLIKPGADATPPSVSLAARRRWRYVPTEACRRWSRALKSRGLSQDTVGGARQAVFAGLAVEAFVPVSTRNEGSTPSLEETARRVWSAYVAVGRSVGFSPVDSVALRAMLDAAADGVILEMRSVHRLLLVIKKRGLLSDDVQFAAGTALETMFVRIKPPFVERFGTVASQITEEWNR